MIDIKLYAAPMEGLTTYIWRRAQRDIFGRVFHARSRTAETRTDQEQIEPVTFR